MSGRIHKALVILILSIGLWLLLATATFADSGFVYDSDTLEQTTTPTPTVTPTAIPTEIPNQQALITITVQPSATNIHVGEQLTVSVHIENRPRTCSFSMYDLTLRQPFSDTQWFHFLSPERLGPPAPTDAEFLLQATNPGTVQLTAELYGEEYCGFWSWAYRYGYSPEIQISPSVTPTLFYYLPVLSR
ncbi:MAG: hypothetical protein U0175_29615 [Caldilineaceae bacterium]